MTRCSPLLAALATSILTTGCPSPDAPGRRPAGPAATRPLAKIDFAQPKKGPAVADVLTTADRSVVVSFVERGGKIKARYVAVDAAARVHWTRLHDCPAKDEPLRLYAADGVLVCKSSRSISALSLADGKPVWRWDAKGRLYITKVAGDRVVTSDDNKALVVLDAKRGKVLQRYDLGDSPLEAVAETKRGPLAYILRMKRDRPEALIAQPVGGPPTPGVKLAPLAPLWTVPFGQASSYEVDAVGQVLLARPRTGQISAYDAATGALKWRAPAAATGRIRAGKTVLISSGTLEGGVPFVAALDPSTGLVRWRRRWSEQAPPSYLGEDQGSVFCGSRSSWRLYRATDGKPLAAGAIEGRAVVGVAGDHATVFDDVERRRRLRVVPLPQRKLAAMAPLPPPPGRPAWMKAGTRLVYDLRIKGTEPQRFELFIRARDPDGALVYGWRAQDGRRGVRVMPKATLEGATVHSDLYGKREGHRTIKNTSIWVSRKVYATLVKRGAIDWYDISSNKRATLRREGHGLHRAKFEAWIGPERSLDLPVLVARGDRDSGRYWITEHAQYPLLARAERRDFTASLVAVIPPRPATGIDVSALKWPPPCSVKGDRACLAEARNLERRGAVDAAFLLAGRVAASAGKRRGDSSVWSAAQSMLTRIRAREFLRWPSLAERLGAACKAGGGRKHPDACLTLAELHDGSDAPEAVAVLEPMCRERRDARACLNLGDIYVQGRGSVAAAPEKAAALFEQLCKRGNMLGCIALGALVTQGKGTKADPPRAARLWRRACDRRAYLGCVALASVYLRGAGVPRDEKKALAALQRACKGREVQACYLLGVLQMRGKGAPQDKGKAAAMFGRACDDGHVQACLLLGHLYREGQGVSKDRTKARDLMRRACEGGVRRACRWLHQKR